MTTFTVKLELDPQAAGYLDSIASDLAEAIAGEGYKVISVKPWATHEDGENASSTTFEDPLSNTLSMGTPPTTPTTQPNDY